MVKSSFLPVLFLSVSATAAVQQKWKSGDTATGFTDPSVVDGCEFWVNDIGYDDTCEASEDYFGITKRQFRTWNPSVPPSCTLTRGSSYCVAGPDGAGSSSSTTAPSPTPAGTLTYSGTAAPTQSGISSSCSQYYLVKGDDTCHSIQDNFMTFTLQQFYSWNPSISTGCEGLEPDYFVCVGAKSSSFSTTSTVSASESGHQPHQTGIPSNCNKWYWVTDGDDCQTIADKFDITKDQFYAWNPATGATCTTLWQKAYVCVGTSEPSTSPSATTISTTGASTTAAGPSLTQSGIAANCVSYYKVQSGDSCWSIVNEKYTYLTQALFTKWNPAIGSSCSILKDEYYCVAVEDAQPMPGTIDSCKKWHLAQKGDGCWQIEQDNSITADQFNRYNPQVGSDCGKLWLGYFVCVGV